MLRWSGMREFTFSLLALLSPEPSASIHACFQHGAKVIGASGGDPDFELPANFIGSARIAHRVVNLNLHELPGMASRAFNPHLRPVFQNLFMRLLLCLLVHRFASLLPVLALYLFRCAFRLSDYFLFLSSPSTTSASITSPPSFVFSSLSPPAVLACSASPSPWGGGGAAEPACCLYMASASL